jgi:acetyltransferase-like isoleucine patch superfamily enzyme
MATKTAACMNTKRSFWGKVRVRLYHAFIRAMQWPRIKYYRMISTATVIDNGATILQPVLFSGKGTIILGKCTLGFFPSPLFFSGYMHIEARESDAKVVIEDNVFINNSASLIAERTSITIEENTLIGPEVSILDSDFHDLAPNSRVGGGHQAKPVRIAQNVFLGLRVTVLKGVTVGRNSVVGAGTTVTKSVPDDTIASGMPPYTERKLK